MLGLQAVGMARDRRCGDGESESIRSGRISARSVSGFRVGLRYHPSRDDEVQGI